MSFSCRKVVLFAFLSKKTDLQWDQTEDIGRWLGFWDWSQYFSIWLLLTEEPLLEWWHWFVIADSWLVIVFLTPWFNTMLKLQLNCLWRYVFFGLSRFQGLVLDTAKYFWKVLDLAINKLSMNHLETSPKGCHAKSKVIITMRVYRYNQRRRKLAKKNQRRRKDWYGIVYLTKILEIF